MTKKMIKILTHGPIYAKGGIYGPISSPFMEDAGTIFRMIANGIKVVEVLADGKEVELDVMNYKKDNSVVEKPVEKKPVPAPEPVKEEKKPEPVKVAEPVVAPAKDAVKKDIKPDTIEKK